MIVFKKIRWKNFLSTGNAFTEVQLDQSPNTIIVGENGAGKSTILDALCFSLFGKPFRKITKQQLVNTINGKGTSVEVEFSIGSNDYVIMRGIKKYGSSPFEIYANGKLVNQPGDARDYQDHLESNILKLNMKSFTQIVILGNASFTPFMELNAPSRREIIEDLLDIKIFSAMNVLLKDKISDNNSDTKETKLKIDVGHEKLGVQEKFLTELQQNKSAQIQANENEIQDTNNKIAQYQKEVEDETKRIKEHENSISDSEKVNSKLNKIRELESAIETKIRKLRKDINFYESNDECPTCKQTLDAERVKTLLTDKKGSLVTTEDALQRLESEYNAVNDRLNDINVVNSEIVIIQEKISNIQSNITASQSYITKIQKDIDKLNKTELNDQETKDKISKIKRALGKWEKMHDQLVTDKVLLDTAADILRDKGIKTKIIKQYVPVMNKLVNKYLAAMDFFVNFELNENFEEVIKSRHRDIFSYSSFSEGEKMRIDLALLFTWRAIAKMKNSVSTNLLVLDEVFDASLDGNGCDEFLKLIHQMGKDTNVFVISHKGDVLADKFFSTLKFEKHKNFSRIAE